MKPAFIVAALASVPALAQAPIPACGQPCALNLLSASGCGSTDIACVCKSSVFNSPDTGYVACVTKACNPTDTAVALNYGVKLCGSAGVTLTLPSATGGSALITPTGNYSAPTAPVAPSTTAPVVVSSGSVATASAAVQTAGAAMMNSYNAVLVSTGLSGIWAFIFFLFR